MKRAETPYRVVSDEKDMQMAVEAGIAAELATTGGKVYGWERGEAFQRTMGDSSSNAQISVEAMANL